MPDQNLFSAALFWEVICKMQIIIWINKHISHFNFSKSKGLDPDSTLAISWGEKDRVFHGSWKFV